MASSLKIKKKHFQLNLLNMHGPEDLVSEPAFARWITHVLKKRNIIINKVHTRMVKKNRTFRIDISIIVLEAEMLDTITK